MMSCWPMTAGPLPISSSRRGGRELSHFFDDYPVCEPDFSAHSAQQQQHILNKTSRLEAGSRARLCAQTIGVQSLSKSSSISCWKSIARRLKAGEPGASITSRKLRANSQMGVSSPMSDTEPKRSGVPLSRVSLYCVRICVAVGSGAEFEARM